MDLVGISIVTTFVSMLLVSAFAVQIQAPPSEQALAEHSDAGSESLHSFHPAPLRIIPSTVIG